MTAFGAFVWPHPADEQFELVRRIEALGYDSVWCADHISFHFALYDPLTALAAFAAITDHIRLGSAVYLLPLRPPTITAKMTATVDVLSRGRLIFGIGVGGENPREFQACGVPYAERGARTTEAIQVVRLLWQQVPASFKGRFTEFDGVTIDPRPLQVPGPPIWVGGRSHAALRRAARHGDGWISYLLRPERYAANVAAIRAIAEADGRPLDDFTFAHMAFVTIGRDYERARALWVRLLSKRYQQDFDPLAEKYGIIGTPDQCAERLEEFRAAGCRYFVMNAICEPTDERDQIEAVMADVVPRFRS